MAISCRFCGGTVTPEQQAYFAGDYCCAAHRSEFESVKARVVRRPDAAGFPLNAGPGPGAESNKAYPAERQRHERRPLPPGFPDFVSASGIASLADALKAIERAGAYPHPLPERDPQGGSRKSSSAQQAKRFWWRKAGLNLPDSAKAPPRVRSTANPSFTPKGFYGPLPINSLQPCFKTISLKGTGDQVMAETVKQDRGEGIAAVLDAPRSKHLPQVRRTAIRLSEKHIARTQPKELSFDPMDFSPEVRFEDSTKLRLPVSGFNFTGQVERPGRYIASPPAGESPLVSVGPLLSEPAAQPPPRIEFAPLVWDELEPAEPIHRDIPALAAALELYEPPANATASPAITANVPPAAETTEPKFSAPGPRESLRFPVPELRDVTADEPAGIEPLTAAGSRLNMPAMSTQPLRHPMSFGPAPESGKPAPAPVEAAAVEPKPVTRQSGGGHGKSKRKQRRESAFEDPIEEPTALSHELEGALAQGILVNDEEFEAAITGAPPVVAAKPEPPATKPKPPVPRHEPKLTLIEPQPEPTTYQSFTLGIMQSEPVAVSAGMGSGAKIGIAAGVATILIGVGVWMFGGSKPAAPPPKPASRTGGSAVEVGGPVIGEAGWSQDWTLDASGARFRHLALYRPSLPVIDYRVEFQAEIEYKAASWAVRVANTKNNYVLKLAQSQNDSGPVFSLVRIPVRDGKPEPPVEKAVPIPYRVGQVFNVRTDVIADRFSVTVQDKLVDQWTDSKLLTGGFAVANEGTERGQIRAVQMWHLRPRSR